MDLSDIETWTRELLVSEARRRGIREAELRATSELVRLILRDQYGARVAARRRRLGAQLEQARAVFGTVIEALPEALGALGGREPTAPPPAPDPVADPAADEPAASAAARPAARARPQTTKAAKPASKPSKASTKATATKPSQPAAKASKAATKPAKASKPSTKSAVPAKPSEASTKPSEASTEPAKASKPSTKPVALASEPSEPSKPSERAVQVVPSATRATGSEQDEVVWVDDAGGARVRWATSVQGRERASVVLGEPGRLALRVISIASDPERAVTTHIEDELLDGEAGECLLAAVPDGARRVVAVGLKSDSRFVSIAHARG